jgi:hypothetical protein
MTSRGLGTMGFVPDFKTMEFTIVIGHEEQMDGKGKGLGDRHRHEKNLT